MAGIKLGLETRVKASTVLEVIVSMVIIITVFGVAMMIYANVTRMSLSNQKIKAEAVLSQVIKDMDKVELSSDQQSVIEGLSVERSVKSYSENNKLLQVDLKAYDQNHQLLAELHQLVIKSDEQ